MPGEGGATAVLDADPGDGRVGGLGVVAVHAAPLTRVGLRSLVEAAPGWAWLGSSAEPRGLLPALARLRPGLVLLDSGLDPQAALTEAVTTRHPSAAVVVVLLRPGHRGPQYLLAARRAGAAGLIADDTDSTELLAFLRLALQRQGGCRVYPEVSGLRSDGRLGLSRREGQVLALIAQGLSHQEIADWLTVSHETVRTHVKAILRKLQARDRAHAIARAYRLGLITAPARATPASLPPTGPAAAGAAPAGARTALATR